MRKEKNKIEPDIIMDESASLVFNEKESYFRQTQDMRRDWESAWASYNNYLEPRKSPWLSNIFIPKVHQAVELLASFLAAKDPTLRARPQNLDDIDKIPKVQKLLTFQWKSIMKMRTKIISMTKQSILFGTGVIKIFWETKTITDKNGKEKIVYDDPGVEAVNLLDLYVDPFAPTTSDAFSIIHRVLADWSKVKENKAYKNQDKLVSVQPKYQNDDSSILNKYDTNQTATANDKVELFERWTKDRLITIGMGKEGAITLRDIPNPYGFIPFVAVHLKDSPLPNRFYGVGAIIPNLSIQDKMNSIANQVIDNIELLINQMYKRKRSATINPKQLISRPGGFIDVDDMTDVEQLQMVDTTVAGFNLYKTLDIEFQQGSGVSNLMKGMQGADFATEIAVQQQNMGTMLGIFQTNLEYAIADIGQKILQLDIDNIQDSRSIVIFKETPPGRTTDGQMVKFYPYEEETINVDDINGIFDIEVIADSTLYQNSITLTKQLIDIYNLVLTDPNSGINRPELLKTIFTLKGIPEVDKLFQNPSPPANPEMTPGAENVGRVPPAGEGLSGIQNQLKGQMGVNFPNNKI